MPRIRAESDSESDTPMPTLKKVKYRHVVDDDDEAASDRDRAPAKKSKASGSSKGKEVSVTMRLSLKSQSVAADHVADAHIVSGAGPRRTLIFGATIMHDLIHTSLQITASSGKKKVVVVDADSEAESEVRVICTFLLICIIVLILSQDLRSSSTLRGSSITYDEPKPGSRAEAKSSKQKVRLNLCASFEVVITLVPRPYLVLKRYQHLRGRS